MNLFCDAAPELEQPRITVCVVSRPPILKASLLAHNNGHPFPPIGLPNMADDKLEQKAPHLTSCYERWRLRDRRVSAQIDNLATAKLD